MNDELKPCPFCGSAPELHKISYPYTIGYYVCCNKCHAEINDVSLTEEGAVKVWNKRTKEE